METGVGAVISRQRIGPVLRQWSVPLLQVFLYPTKSATVLCHLAQSPLGRRTHLSGSNVQYLAWQSDKHTESHNCTEHFCLVCAFFSRNPAKGTQKGKLQDRKTISAERKPLCPRDATLFPSQRKRQTQESSVGFLGWTNLKSAKQHLRKPGDSWRKTANKLGAISKLKCCLELWN